jgi:hypothetical protein
MTTALQSTKAIVTIEMIFVLVQIIVVKFNDTIAAGEDVLAGHD